jgi:hypothetical protein
MSQAFTKNINLQDLLDSARRETQALMEQGIDISDPSIVTPLESTANQYPELASDCNQSLIELVRQQLSLLAQQESSQITNDF